MILSEIANKAADLFLKGEAIGSDGSMVLLRTEGFSTKVFLLALGDSFSITLKKVPESNSGITIWGQKGTIRYQITPDTVREYRDEKITCEGEEAMRKLDWVFQHCGPLS